MAIGKRIKFFRNKKGMTQKQFGEMLGFLGKTSDVRMAQYEAEARIPKFDLLKEMAGILSVSTHALNVPDIDSYIGLMHTFFALEDMYGLKIKDIDGELCLCLDRNNPSYLSMFDMFHAWQQHWKTEKSAGKNMMNGDTNIRHLIHPDIMQKFLLRN